MNNIKLKIRDKLKLNMTSLMYLSALAVKLLYFLIAVLTFFGLVELYEPFFTKISYQDLDYRFYVTLTGDLSYRDNMLIRLLILGVIVVLYLFLQYKITLHENKNSEVKKLFARKLFLVVPVQIGLGFLVASLVYVFFSFFDVVNTESLLGVAAKFLVSLLIFLPVMVHNVYLLKQEGNSLVNILLK